MKKKLIRITTIPYSIGSLLKGQLRYMSDHYEVIGIASSEPEGELEKAALSQNARAIPINMTRKITPWKDLVSLFQLYRVLRAERPFFVHTHTPKAGLIGMMAAWMARVPHRLHDIAGLPLLEASGTKLKVLTLVEKLTYACATRVYPNSREMHKIVLQRKFAPPGKFKVLDKISSNGVDTELFNPDLFEPSQRRELRNSLGIDPEDFVGIFVGRLVKDKGINELVSVFDALSKKYDDLRLLLVGMLETDLDPLKESTLKKIAENPAIISAGTQSDVRPYFAIADILVFPSYREGFPNVPLEAGSMGLPSIVTDINGCNETVEHGKNGLIVAPKNEEQLSIAIEELKNNPGLMSALAANARPMITERFEQRSIWEAILKEYKDLETGTGRESVPAY